MPRSTSRARKPTTDAVVTTPQFPPNELYTIEQAAELLRVPPRRMKRWAYNGAVKSIVLPGGRGRRISGAALTAAMTEATPVTYTH